MRLSELKPPPQKSEIEHKNRRNRRSFLITREWTLGTISPRNTLTSMGRRIREAAAEVEGRIVEVVAEEQMKEEVGEMTQKEEDAEDGAVVEIVIMAETNSKMSVVRNLAPKTKLQAKTSHSSTWTKTSPMRRN